jgi:formyltetrahydrofolate deformylase
MNDQPTTAVLLLSCPDQKGLVASVADFIYKNNGNIVHADQHIDTEADIFFQRVEWEMSGFRLGREEIARLFQPIAQRFGMTWSLHFSDFRPRVAVMVSRQPHCLYELLIKQRMGELKADIPLVVSNHPDLEALAKGFGVEYRSFPVTPDSRSIQEAQVLKVLQDYQIDMIVLARYMQVLSEAFVGRYQSRIINIHHSFLPAFTGASPYRQAHQRGVKIIGATAHYVTAELDQGPIIEQDVVRVSHRDSVADLIRQGRDLEKTVLARAVDLHVRNRVIVYGNKTVVFG